MKFSDIDFDEILRDDAQLEKQVFVSGDRIIVNVAYEYSIPLNECETSEQILDYVYQLADKNWITVPVLQRFIALANMKQK